MEVISVQSSSFKHQQVEAELRLLAATLPVGSRLPAERSLAQHFGCNFLTVRRALKVLVEEGTVVRRVGIGTFIARNVAVDTEDGVLHDRLGVLIWNRGDAYANRVVQGLADAARGLKVDLRTSKIGDFARDGVESVRRLAEEGCRAITLPWFPHDRLDEVRTFLRQCSLPVSLPMVVPGFESNCFENQEVFGGNLVGLAEQLCDYFHALGHRRIALIGPALSDDPVLQRFLSGYVCHISKANGSALCGLVRPGSLAMEQLAERWAEFRRDLAVIAYDDEHALRFMAAMEKRGLKAPDDFVILGCNDSKAAALAEPALSSVGHKPDYVGHWLIRSALALARGELDQSGSPPRPQLMVRSSCGGHARIDDAFCRKLPGLDLHCQPAGDASEITE